MASRAGIVAIKPALALALSVLLSAGILACGDSAGTNRALGVSPHTQQETTTTVATPGGYLKNDGDKDPDDLTHNALSPEYDSPILFAHFPRKADPADTRAVAAIVKSYYAASAADEGAKACSLLTAGLADALGTGRGRSTGSASGGCAESMTRLLRQQHQGPTPAEVSTMVVTSVHVKGNLGVAALGFKGTSESEILVEREGHAWKVDALFGGLMP